jgi:hypothetical protein
MSIPSHCKPDLQPTASPSNVSCVFEHYAVERLNALQEESFPRALYAGPVSDVATIPCNIVYAGLPHFDGWHIDIRLINSQQIDVLQGDRYDCVALLLEHYDVSNVEGMSEEQEDRVLEDLQAYTQT